MIHCWAMHPQPHPRERLRCKAQQPEPKSKVAPGRTASDPLSLKATPKTPCWGPAPTTPSSPAASAASPAPAPDACAAAAPSAPSSRRPPAAASAPAAASPPSPRRPASCAAAGDGVSTAGAPHTHPGLTGPPRAGHKRGFGHLLRRVSPGEGWCPFDGQGKGTTGIAGGALSLPQGMLPRSPTHQGSTSHETPRTCLSKSRHVDGHSSGKHTDWPQLREILWVLSTGDTQHIVCTQRVSFFQPCVSAQCGWSKWSSNRQ